MLFLSVCVHTDTQQPLLVKSVTLMPPYASHCLLPGLSSQWPHFKLRREGPKIYWRGEVLR